MTWFYLQNLSQGDFILKEKHQTFYKLLSSLSDVNLTKGGGSDFRLLDASAVEVMRNFNEDDLFQRVDELDGL
jgi:dolichol-phosphate mannosyltransferase